MSMIINPYVYGTTTSPGVVPPAITSDMKLWLKSDAGVTTVLSGSTPLVSGWADQTTNGNNGFQNTTSYRPVYYSTDSTLNNLPALDFQAGGDDSMQIVASTSLNFSANGFTIYIVANVTSWFSTYSTLMQHSNGSTWTQGWGIMGVPGSNLRFFLNNWNNTANYIDLPLPTTNKKTLFKFQWDKAAGVMRASYFQGTSGMNNNATKAFTLTYTNPAEALEIFRGGFGAVSYDTSGKLGDIIMYSGATSTSVDNDVQTYLKQKYNIV